MMMTIYSTLNSTYGDIECIIVTDYSADSNLVVNEQDQTSVLNKYSTSILALNNENVSLLNFHNRTDETLENFTISAK